MPRATNARLIALFIAALACASTPKRDSSSPSPLRVDMSRLDSTEIRGGDFSNVYQAIMAKRPDWFRTSGGVNSLPAPGKPNATPEVGIFIEGSRKPQDIEFLKGLVPRDVRALRHLTSSESMVTFGWGWGAIVVSMAR